MDLRIELRAMGKISESALQHNIFWRAIREFEEKICRCPVAVKAIGTIDSQMD